MEKNKNWYTPNLSKILPGEKIFIFLFLKIAAVRTKSELHGIKVYLS